VSRIISLGTDLCDMRRIEAAMDRFGTRFLDRVFTTEERAHAERRNGAARIGTYAKRWAAKEACAKALGTGFSGGVFHSDIGVRNRPGGAPMLVLTGGAAAHLGRITPAGMTIDMQLSLTDEHPYALAQVLFQTLSQDERRASAP